MPIMRHDVLVVLRLGLGAIKAIGLCRVELEQDHATGPTLLVGATGSTYF